MSSRLVMSESQDVKIGRINDLNGATPFDRAALL